mgnify:FL=1
MKSLLLFAITIALILASRWGFTHEQVGLGVGLLFAAGVTGIVALVINHEEHTGR